MNNLEKFEGLEAPEQKATSEQPKIEVEPHDPVAAIEVEEAERSQIEREREEQIVKAQEEIAELSKGSSEIVRDKVTLAKARRTRPVNRDMYGNTVPLSEVADHPNPMAEWFRRIFNISSRQAEINERGKKDFDQLVEDSRKGMIKRHPKAPIKRHREEEEIIDYKSRQYKDND